MYYQQQLCRPSSSETVLQGAERLQVQHSSVSAQHQDIEDESMNSVPNKDSLTRYPIITYSPVHSQLNHAIVLVCFFLKVQKHFCRNVFNPLRLRL